MRALCVVDLEPLLGDQSYLSEHLEDVGGQHSLPIRPVEPVDKRVLLRRARLGVRLAARGRSADS